MIASQFKLFQFRMKECVATEHHVTVVCRGHHSADGVHDGVFQPLVLHVLEALHDAAVSAVLREAHHHHLHGIVLRFFLAWKGRKEMFYLTTHSTHFIYGYMASDIWLRTILIVRKETRCRHISYSFRLAAKVLLYAPSHRQDSTYHSLCYISRGALAGTRNSSMGPPHEGSIRWPIAPWVNALTTELHLAPAWKLILRKDYIEIIKYTFLTTYLTTQTF